MSFCSSLDEVKECYIDNNDNHICIVAYVKTLELLEKESIRWYESRCKKKNYGTLC